MQAILIDDEQLALADLARQLKDVGIEVAGQFVKPQEGLQAVLQNKPDIVFLDIEMPGINGVELAEKLLEERPQQEIVFVTAYNEYAVKAFELNALDYLLKPVQRDRLLKTVERVCRRIEGGGPRQIKQSVPLGSVQVKTFGELRFITADDRTVTPSWRTTKALELFAYLLHNRGGPVDRDALLEALWPDVPLDRAYTLLYTTVYQVRKTLARYTDEIQVKSINQTYRLAPQTVTTDAGLWSQQLESPPPLESQSLDWYMQLLAAQPADYLEAYDFLWAEAERHRLRSLWVQYALRTANLCLGGATVNQALSLYFQILERDPYAEQAHFGLMKCYALLGDRGAVEERFQALGTMMEEQFALPPNPEIMSWYSQWRQGIS